MIHLSSTYYMSGLPLMLGRTETYSSCLCDAVPAEILPGRRNVMNREALEQDSAGNTVNLGDLYK